MKEKDKKWSDSYLKIVLFMKESDFCGVNTKLKVRETKKKEHLSNVWESKNIFWTIDIKNEYYKAQLHEMILLEEINAVCEAKWWWACRPGPL